MGASEGQERGALLLVVARFDRMKASVLKTEFERGGSLQSLLLRYLQAQHASSRKTLPAIASIIWRGD
jgi:hypothetical protein